MSSEFDERKVKSNDIVNGMARRDIFDEHGVLQVKKGSRISADHYERLREEGLIQQDQQQQKKALLNDINYVAPDGFHSRLENLLQRFRQLQKHWLLKSLFDSQQQQQLWQFIADLNAMLAEKPQQILGELYLSELRHAGFNRPLYCAAQMVLLIERYNKLKAGQSILSTDQPQLILAALTLELGQLAALPKQIHHTEVKAWRAEFRQRSVEMLQASGLESDLAQQWILDSATTPASMQAEMLSICGQYALLALPKREQDLSNPSRSFAVGLKSGQLNTLLAGLLLKINGMSPIGSILKSDMNESFVVVRGPDPDNITSSWVRPLTNRNGVQLKRPGERRPLQGLDLKLAAHHQFAWINFAPHVMWER